MSAKWGIWYVAVFVFMELVLIRPENLRELFMTAFIYWATVVVITEGAAWFAARQR